MQLMPGVVAWSTQHQATVKVPVMQLHQRSNSAVVVFATRIAHSGMLDRPFCNTVSFSSSSELVWGEHHAGWREAASYQVLRSTGTFDNNPYLPP
jgi:hypothetical protein